MAKPRFTMIVLLIEDLPRSLAFYRRLGMEFPADADGKTDIGLDIGDGRTIIWTTTFEKYDREREALRGSSRVMLEFFVDSNRAVDALFAELTRVGHHGRRARSCPTSTRTCAWSTIRTATRSSSPPGDARREVRRPGANAHP